MGCVCGAKKKAGGLTFAACVMLPLCTVDVSVLSKDHFCSNEVQPGSVLSNMCDFVALLHPLPLDLLPFVFVAFRESSGETFWATLQRLTSHVDRALCANLNPDTAAAVRHKLQVWESQQRLPGPATVVCVPCLGTSCGDCGRELTPLESLRCKVLTFDKGSVPAVCDVSRCDPCRTTFFGGVCSVDGVLGLHLRQCPSDMPYFGLLPPHPGGLCFVEKNVLEFLSLAVLHWRGSFVGFQNIWDKLYAEKLPSRLRQHLFHGWLFWRAQILLRGTSFQAEALRIPLRLVSVPTGPTCSNLSLPVGYTSQCIPSCLLPFVLWVVR